MIVRAPCLKPPQKAWWFVPISPEMIALLKSIGIGGLLALAIWAALTKRIVGGWIYAAKEKECEEWKQKYLSLLERTNQRSGSTPTTSG